ncbi:MAG: TRAP transporter large permease [Beijerinckiaceae bacterium]
MSNAMVGLLSILGMLALIQLGMHISIALMLLSFIGAWMIRGDFVIAGDMLSLSAMESIAYYSFGVIPLFVLMGLLVDVSRIGRDTFDVAASVTRRIRGGVGMATVGANAVFAAVNGTSIASASLFTKVAVPEMLRLGYAPRFSVGVVAGSSILGMLIPPSLLLILFGIITETSIGQLFTGGILPGLMMSAAFMLLILALVHFAPAFVFADGAGSREPALYTLVQQARMIAPVVLLIALVLGGIYGGLFTPTEAGGVGALGALVLALVRRALTPQSLWRTLLETGRVTASLSMLLVGAHLYANMLALSGLPNHLGEWMTSSGLGFYTLLAIYLVVILLMGTILDSASIMLIVIPLVLPTMQALNVDIVWFGVITVVAVEVGLLTPPLGVACFAIKSNLNDPRITLNDIFWGAAPFALTMVAVLILLVLFPKIVTVLL